MVEERDNTISWQGNGRKAGRNQEVIQLMETHETRANKKPRLCLTNMRKLARQEDLAKFYASSKGMKKSS